MPAATVIRSDERGLPRETVDVDADGLDFRDRRPIGATVLDHASATSTATATASPGSPSTIPHPATA